MIYFLKDHFQNDPKKEFYLIEEEHTAKVRQEGRKPRPVPGCKAAHVISFYPDGDSVRLWSTVKDFLEGKEVDAADEYTVDDENVDFNVESEPVWSESIENTELFNLIEIIHLLQYVRHPIVWNCFT